MSKTIDISKVSLTPKGIAMLIVGVVVIIGVYKISSWAYTKIAGTAQTASSSFNTV